MNGAHAGAVVPRRYNFFSANRSEPADVRGPFSEYPQQQHSKPPAPDQQQQQQQPLASVALREAIDVQAETLSAIARVEHAINTAEQLGEESRKQLEEDRTIIEVIDTALEKNESALRRAKRDVSWLWVHLQKDKVFLCLFAVAVLLSVAAIIVAVVRKRRG